MDKSSVAILDLETTGLQPQQDRIVEVAVGLYDNDFSEIDFFTTLVRPKKNSFFIPPEASRVNKITSDMLKRDGKLWRVIAPKVHELIDSSQILCAYNSKFDISFLKNAFKGVGLEMPKMDVVDPYLMALKYIPNDIIRNKRLSTICDFFGVHIGDSAHRADHDVRATAKLLKNFKTKLSEELGNNSNSKIGPWYMERELLDPCVDMYLGLPKRSY